ncbi:non-hydrolyzing UDP-N-acetylglucosamine 2-epimerase [Micromonospora sediminimaris]|uniref:UDP-N-acetylglucosamine 2-epimerase (Non-hydrolyzing) n=1 Tax=Micromonospora sediminimaris TaxID=547162 RepID=A0A9W5UPU1_9ACTN|nr:UDP-N-acetylglucosamine 2-epimerase (non-hydrolyzing) [Micromonospora sediminimaris]GIJ33479.1 UDP-N-acetylglucosamine 2-epimerase (non-hydrolyzing) [Micromonospora sediminimaris]SFC92514.1 UDP-N-acetylglucosamine 2-epimerase (non-hydrolysing) [Micromonospora sediminimaris]
MSTNIPFQVVHVTGARPNFPKAAPVVRALDDRSVRQRLIHTGQHYDERMSNVFFRQLGLPEPDENLAVGSGSHASQTGEIMVRLERLLMVSRPSLIVVYGDVNSTLAATLVATKLDIPVAHVEAGLRSFNRSMPEEINRLVTDRLSQLLFATSPDALVHLGNEGLDPSKVHFVGNPMIDTLLANLHLFDVPLIRRQLALPQRYGVATLHRPANVDDPGDAAELSKALHTVADQLPIVLPLHPRGRERLATAGLFRHPQIRVIEPQGYVEFLSLVRGAQVVITDSGGVQEETTVLGVPCLTLRAETERPVTITHGTNRLVNREDLAEAVKALLEVQRPAAGWPTPPLWDGRAGIRIADVIAQFVGAG